MWNLHGPLPLLKTPKALIEECRDQRKLVGLTYQSDSAGSDLQPLPQEPGFQDWWQVLQVPFQPALGAAPRQVLLQHCRRSGAAALDQAQGSCSQPFSSQNCYFQLSIGFFYTLKSEPYCLLKCGRFLIQISNVLVWINNAVASKVPAGKGKQWLQQSASCTKPGLCVETWHLLFICLLSS